MTAADARARILERFGVEAVADGGLTVTLPRERWQEFAGFARGDLGCRFFNFLSAVDWKEAGLEVVACLDNLDDNVSLRLKTRLAPGDPRCQSLVPVYRGADWMERECYDMFGVVFDGHPDLRRILTSDDWEGYPLRKDYAVDTPYEPYR